MHGLNVSQSHKKRMLAEFDRRMSSKQTDEQWRLEKQVILQFENIFLLLAASKEWVVQGKQILFYRDDEIARFNSYIDTIQTLTQQQEQIVKQKLEAVKNAAVK